MIRKKKGLIEWLEFELFTDCKSLLHGIFLRHGGVSEGSFGSLNFGLTQGDLPEKVEENKRRALTTLGLSNAISSLQVHGKTVQEITSQSEECDGLMTAHRGVGLLMTHADCQAAIFYDPLSQAVANIHCGWRGNVQNIYQETVSQMQKCYGSKAENLLVGISPSLGPQAAEFYNFRTELPKSFWEFQVKPTYFDLWEISRSQLIASGILPHHIEIAKICTYDNPEDFFSYRRQKASGRHATIVALSPNL